MEQADLVADQAGDSPVSSMDLPHHTASLELVPGHSAASIMEVSPEASPPAGSLALAEASMVEAFMEAEAVADDSIQLTRTQLMIWRKSHAHEQYEA
jgi:hypothetical protein